MNRFLCLNLVTVLMMCALPVWAQAPSSSPPTSPPTFASALASATVPANTIAMAVQAENVPLQFHGPHVSVTQIGDAYGCLVRRFGNVTALAPPTMIVLNSHPSQPNIYADLQPNETAKLLLASLSQSQWQALTSEQGMGMSDLTDDNQRQMFMALFPGGKLKIYTNGERQKGSQDLSQEFPQAHLRIYQKTEIFLPLQGNTGESVSMDVASQPGQPKTYNIEQDYQEKATEYGVPVRAEQPNILKPSDLDYNSNAVHVPIVLAGLKSVSDLVSRIAQQSHLELYTDPRYSNQSLTLVGQLPTAYASDLLRALSLCLTGTWRQVGPAFVLTFDETGLGTTRQIWQNFEQQAQNLKRAPMDAAGDKMVTDHSLQDLNAFGDTLAITPDQTAAWKKDNPDDYSYSGTPRMMRFAVSQLTPAQQATMKAMNDMWVEMAKNPMNNERGTDISGKIGVESVPTLQLLLPSLDGPVTMHQMFDLFQPSPKMQQEMWQKHSAAQVKPLSPTAQPAMPLLAEVMGRIQSRVVLASPRTPADVTAIVGAMKTLGFNQLWVTVFSEGQSHPDLLVAALKATKGSGIAVFPVLSLLQWGMDAPPETRDLTILGETSAQMEQVNQQAQNAVSIAAGQKPFPLTPPISLFVMPGSSQVAGTLANFVHFYGTHPGIAGLIWTETASVGYTSSISYGQQGLGYALPARLEFLRQFHPTPLISAQVRRSTPTSRILATI